MKGRRRLVSLVIALALLPAWVGIPHAATPVHAVGAPPGLDSRLCGDSTYSVADIRPWYGPPGTVITIYVGRDNVTFSTVAFYRNTGLSVGTVVSVPVNPGGTVFNTGGTLTFAAPPAPVHRLSRGRPLGRQAAGGEHQHGERRQGLAGLLGELAQPPIPTPTRTPRALTLMTNGPACASFDEVAYVFTINDANPNGDHGGVSSAVGGAPLGNPIEVSGIDYRNMDGSVIWRAVAFIHIVGVDTGNVQVLYTVTITGSGSSFQILMPSVTPTLTRVSTCPNGLT